MSNPIFQAMGGIAGMPMPGPLGKFQQMRQQFEQFRSGYTGNAQQEVQQLLASGKMNQQQFNQLAQAASMFQSIFK